MAVEVLFPKPPDEGVWLGSINVDTRFEGRVTPSFYNLDMTNSGDVLHYFVDCIETTAPTGTSTGGVPRMYAGANKTMYRLDNGTRTADTTFNDVVQGMCIGDNGSGVKQLIVGFGSSTNPRVAYRSLTTDTTPWTVQTSSTYAQFWLICKAGPDLYAVTDAGVAILGEYRVSKCPAGNDPTLAASWGNGLECGTPEWAIVGLAAIGDSIVAGKPDGLYYYNDQTKRFENVLPHLEKAPHATNGKGMRAVTNGVLYPTHDGKLYFFDGVAVQEVTPLKGKTLPRDVGTSRITAIADNGDTVAVVTECWQNTTQYAGLKVVTRIAGTYTDVTSSVTDGDLTTGANVGTFGAAADDAIFVGSDYPIEAIVFRVTRNVNAAVQSFTTPEYSNGTAGGTAPFNSSFTSFTAIVDGSILSTAATSLVNTGFPTGASNAVITWTDIDAYKKMKSTTISFGGSIGDLTKYWVRLKRTTTTGMTASTTIDEVEIVPGRAGLPDTGQITQSTNFTNRDRAGGLTHIWMGKRERTVGFVWHDVYAVHTLGGVWAIGWHTGRVPFGNLGQGLVLWGRFSQSQISEGWTRDPSRSLDPLLAAWGTLLPGPLWNIAPLGTYLGDPTRRKQVNTVYIDTHFAEGEDAVSLGATTDDFSLYMQWDERDIVHLAKWAGGPATIKVNQGEGRILKLWLSINYSFSHLHCPEIRGVYVDYDYVGDPYDFARDPASTIPEKT